MASKKKATPKGSNQKTLKGSKKLGNTKLMWGVGRGIG